MSFDKFEEWERHVDAIAQVKKRQDKLQREYGGIAQQNGVLGKLVKQKSIDKGEKKKEHLTSRKSKGFSFRELTTLDARNNEFTKKLKVEKWLQSNDFVRSSEVKNKQSPPTIYRKSHSRSRSYSQNKYKNFDEDLDTHEDIGKLKRRKLSSSHQSTESKTLSKQTSKDRTLIVVDSSDGESQNEMSNIGREIKTEYYDDISEDFTPKSQKKIEKEVEQVRMKIKHETQDNEQYLPPPTTVKKEVRSPLSKTTLRPASFILKPKGEDVYVQTDIDTNRLMELKNVSDLPAQLKNETMYKFTIDIQNDQFVHKSSSTITDGKGNDLQNWFSYILDNYKSKHDYKGEVGCNCFITLDSRFMVMLSCHSERQAVVEVLTDASDEDNWMRNLRSPIRIFNVIEKHSYAPMLGKELSDQLPEFITTRIFPK